MTHSHPQQPDFGVDRLTAACVARITFGGALRRRTLPALAAVAAAGNARGRERRHDRPPTA